MLLTDAFGGRGGIAKFNRDFLNALCAFPECEEATAVPRLITSDPGVLPAKLDYIINGLNGKINYIFTVMKSVLRRQNKDLIICGHINLLPAAFLAKIILRVPVVLIIHGIDAWTPTKSALSNYLAKRLDYFISVSEFTKKRFLEWTGLNEDKGFILPNCIDLSLYGPGPKNENLLKRYGLHDRKVLMTMGRISADERYKGFDEVLEVLPELAREVPKISYMIVGDGSDRIRLEERAKALGVDDRVVFTGWIPDGEKVGHFQLADVYVMPGHGEGFGIVYLEALACGLPVIASRIDGSREAVLNGKLGVLVDPADRTELKKAVLAAIKSPRGIVAEGLSYFSFENFITRLAGIITHKR